MHNIIKMSSTTLNTAAPGPKIIGIPPCVDMATIAMATELGHMAMQMLFIL